jgi:hypothetical protein
LFTETGLRAKAHWSKGAVQLGAYCGGLNVSDGVETACLAGGDHCFPGRERARRAAALAMAYY